jgi:hypothetical protein
LRRAFDGAATVVAESPRSGLGVAASVSTTNTAPPSAEWKMKNGEWKMEDEEGAPPVSLFFILHFSFLIPP